MDYLENARREAIRILSAAHAQDVISLEAFESRLDRIKQAVNYATIDAVLADVPETGRFALSTLSAVPLPQSPDHLGAAPVAPADYLRVASVFASSKRAGSWTVPLALEAKVLFGELVLDLRDSVFASDVLDIDVDVKFGQLTVIVPAGSQVENEVHEVLSSSTHSTRDARGIGPIGLLIRLQGRVLLGSIAVKEKPPSTGPVRTSFWAKLLESGD